MRKTIGCFREWLKPSASKLLAAQGNIPRIDYSMVPENGHDIFYTNFGHLSEMDWNALLLRSMNNSQIEHVEFPTFPDEGLQQRIHGHSGAASVKESIEFHDFISTATFAGVKSRNEFKILDFGCGWGRMTRPFLRDFPLTNIFGFEPNFLFCTLARSLNPYITTFSGSYTPNNDLPACFFDLIFGWSIFSHLSLASLTAWLNEMERVLKPGGHCVFTTWGGRFLNRLRSEEADQQAGKEIHWYSALCIAAAGSLDERLRQYNAGEFVWWDSIGNPNYGEAFISRAFLQQTIDLERFKFTIEKFDDETLAQDAFVLKRL